jgi:hypothetical protein
MAGLGEDNDELSALPVKPQLGRRPSSRGPQHSVRSSGDALTVVLPPTGLSMGDAALIHRAFTSLLPLPPTPKPSKTHFIYQCDQWEALDVVARHGLHLPVFLFGGKFTLLHLAANLGYADIIETCTFFIIRFILNHFLGGCIDCASSLNDSPLVCISVPLRLWFSFR